MTADATAERYLAKLAGRVRGVLGDELVGVYAGGSVAFGDYDPQRSDLDVAVVAREPLSREQAHELVARIRHEELPCPAQGLELVVYPLAATREPSTEAGFSLNLNTGAHRPFRVDHDGTGVERHWFPIDRSILAQRGVALLGPPAQEVFADLPPRELLPVVLEALEWHAPGAAGTDDVVLNTARTLRYAQEGVWSSKPQAARWALDARPEDRAVVEAALAARRGGPQVDAAAAEDFRLSVAARARALLHTSPDGD